MLIPRRPNSDEPGQPNCQLCINHFKLAPGQLHVPGTERNIVSVPPFGSDNCAGLQSKQIADPKTAERNGHIEFHRQPRRPGVRWNQHLGFERLQGGNEGLFDMLGRSLLANRLNLRHCWG
jgi:hypothetical protein